MKDSALNFLSLFSLTAILSGCSAASAPHRAPDAMAQARIHRVVETLPVDSSIRRSLEMGRFGDGVHQSWMDEMQALGISEVMFEIHGVWHWGSLSPRTVKRTIYRTKYDGPNSQIIDSARLEQIRASGLETKLQQAAFVKASHSNWPFEARSPSLFGVQCFVNVYLFDEEWILDPARLSDTPTMGGYDPWDTPLQSAAEVGDLRTVQSLLNSKTFSKAELDNALLDAVSYPSDNTDVITILIGAGANPSAVRSDGISVLMVSIDSLNEHNIRLLVSSGADRSYKDRKGETAFYMLQNRIAAAQWSMPSYARDVANLLDPDQSPSK